MASVHGARSLKRAVPGISSVFNTTSGSRVAPLPAAPTTPSPSSGLLGSLAPHLRTSAGAVRSRPYIGFAEQVRAAQLLRARAHLGHAASRLQPRLTGQLAGVRHGVAVFDVAKTWRSMRAVFYAFAEMAAFRSSFFLLAPNTHLPLRGLVEQLRRQYPFRHDRFGSLYMTGYSDRRWVDGLFSNWKVTTEYARRVRQVLGEKPALRKFRRLQRDLRGTEDAQAAGGAFARVVPDFVLVLATDKGALHEARNAAVPLLGLVDSNTDPSPFLYPVYANDDSLESIQFFLDLVRRGVEEGRRREQEAFALLMVRKIKQSLDPMAGRSSPETNPAADSWTPPPFDSAMVAGLKRASTR